MKTILFLALGASVSVSAIAAPVIPEPYPADRYERMLEESPFDIATKPVETPEQVDSFAKTWYIASMAKIAGADGVEQDIVTVKTQDGRIFSLAGNEVHPEERVQIVKVNWHDDPLQTVVEVKKGTEFDKIKFNPADYSSPPASGVQLRPTGQPGQPGAPGGFPGRGSGGSAGPGGRGPSSRSGGPSGASAVPRPTNAPQIPTPQTLQQNLRNQAFPANNQQSRRGQSNEQALRNQAFPANPQPTTNSNDGNSRRRVRVINNRPGQR